MARDPAEIYLGNERKTCAGCVHATRIDVAGESRLACAKGKRYGKRCHIYVERQPGPR